MLYKLAREIGSTLGLKQEVFAHKPDVSREYYSRIERGLVTPSDELAQKLYELVIHYVTVHHALSYENSHKLRGHVLEALRPRQHKINQVLASDRHADIVSIIHPSWIRRFEEWMVDQGFKPRTVVTILSDFKALSRYAAKKS